MAAANMRVSAEKSNDTANAASDNGGSGEGGSGGSGKRVSNAKRTTPKRTTEASTNNSPTRKSTQRTAGISQSNKPGNRGTTKRTRNAPRTAGVQPSTAPRKVTLGSRTRAISLRTDLQKHIKESYEPEDFMQGTQLIISAGAGGALRDMVASVLRSQGAFGNMQSEHAMEGLLDLLTDGYRKHKVAERKGMRAVLNWCSGLAETDPKIEAELLALVLSQGSSGGNLGG